MLNIKHHRFCNFIIKSKFLYHQFIIKTWTHSSKHNPKSKIKRMKPEPLRSFSSPTSLLIRKPPISPYFLFTFLAFIIFAIFLYGEDLRCIIGQQHHLHLDHINPNPPPPSAATGTLSFLFELTGKLKMRFEIETFPAIYN